MLVYNKISKFWIISDIISVVVVIFLLIWPSHDNCDSCINNF
jgi:hypothetical protein